MKLVAIAGSISEKSYNKKLLEFAKLKFNGRIDIEILDISGIPIFNESLDYKDYPKLIELNDKIEEADGVIIATPEHNYTIPAVLKSILEWFSYKLQPFKSKPVLVLGASYTEQGTAKAQSHLREVLNAPGIEAFVIPGSEFLLSNALEKFDKDGFLVDEETIDYLEYVILRFEKFAELFKDFDDSDIDSAYIRTLAAGGYIEEDPYDDGTAGASEW